MDMRFGLWNVRSLYRAGSLMAVSMELSKYKLDLVGVQEVRWGGSGTEPAGEYTFFYRKGNENHELAQVFLRIRESYQQLRGLSLLVTCYHACTLEFFSDLLICLGTYHFRKDIPQFDVYS
jgi:hypothetical protein